ncbi:MAG: protein translocase SEC61 complex subunit gamma [Candidatus Nanohaloarchaea archaeon]
MELKPREWKRELTDKLREYRRVLKIAEKPDREEFEMSAKVTGAGIILIGTIGFVFYLASALIPNYL